MDINSLISQYLKTNNEADINSVESALSNLKKSFGSVADMSTSSIFTLDDSSDTVSESDFVELMCNATGKSSSEIQDDVSILFSILDNEETGKGTLSKSELSIFLDGDGISEFRIWDILSGVDTKSIESYSASLSEDTAETEETSTTSETTETKETDKTETSETAIVDVETEKTEETNETDKTEATETAETKESDSTDETETTGAAEEAETEAETEANLESYSSGNTSASSYDFSNTKSAKEFVQKFMDSGDEQFNTPGEVIDWLLSEDIVSEEEAQLLRNAYSSYTEKEQAQIDALVATGKYTYEEAVEKLQSSGKISENTSGLNEEVVNTISDEDAKLYADQLHDSMKGGFFFGLGTDDEQFDAILNNANLNSSDWVKIISQYNENYGSLIKDVDDDFSGDTQDKIQAKLADFLLDAADKGSDDAIKLLCQEFYNGTAGQWLTADEFIERIFSKGSDEIIAKMARHYNEVTGSDIFKDIKGDFSFSTEDNYIKRINDAISKYRDV